jgi:hypothetical protein
MGGTADPTVVTRAIEILGLLLAAAFLWRARRGGWREYAVVALAGFLAEESSMLLYGYYGYANQWALVLDRTPLAVALLWPVVVLSSLSLVRLSPGLGRPAAILWTAALVTWDTLVVEPVATNAGLWWWRDGGYFGVPVLGVLGWGFFAAAAAAVLWNRRRIAAIDFLTLPVVIAALTQAVLAPLAFPAIAYDWTVPLSREGYAWLVGGLAVALVPVAWRLRRRVRVELQHIAFKVAGAAMFFGLLYGLWIAPLVVFCSLVPVPYWFVLELRPIARFVGGALGRRPAR